MEYKETAELMRKLPIIITIEGNIGSGKSTLVKNLEDAFSESDSVHFLQEPIDEWNTIKDENGKTMIEKYYENQEKYAFSFQMMAYISRLTRLRNALKTNPKVIITERSIFTDKNVFASMLYKDKKIEEVEYTIYIKWFEEFLKDIPPISTIYIRTTPEIAKQRVDIRARKGETIPLEYLKLCHEYHEQWLNNNSDTCKNDILILDGNIDVRENPQIIDEWIEMIKTKIM
jgi:deoxycitidine kinase/deoxyguanosine kinase